MGSGTNGCKSRWCPSTALISKARFARTIVGSVTKRLLSSTALKAHGSSSWHGMDGACAQRLHLLEDSATSLFMSCTHRCSGQGCTATFLLCFHQALHMPLQPDESCGVEEHYMDSTTETTSCHSISLRPEARLRQSSSSRVWRRNCQTGRSRASPCPEPGLAEFYLVARWPNHEQPART